jgi:hypothetical protein
MRLLIFFLLLAANAIATAETVKVPPQDAVRIDEFYRLAGQIAGKVWPGWEQTAAPLLLITLENEFLFRYENPPTDFKKAGEGIYVRPRQFPPNLLATFPAFGPQSVIVIGEAENTNAKTSTPWVLTLMHEHFHQLQDSQPGIFEAENGLGLAHGDKTGMWMLNYPFPYENPELGRSFADLRDRLLAALGETDEKKFRLLTSEYAEARKKFFSQLSTDDCKYLSFQLWREGIARYVQVKSAEAAADYKPGNDYTKLAEYESFTDYATQARRETLQELKKADLAKQKRVAVYSFGACEGFLLDRLDPEWKTTYFKNLFTLDPYFSVLLAEHSAQ